MMRRANHSPLFSQERQSPATFLISGNFIHLNSESKLRSCKCAVPSSVMHMHILIIQHNMLLLGEASKND